MFVTANELQRELALLKNCAIHIASAYLSKGEKKIILLLGGRYIYMRHYLTAEKSVPFLKI